MSKKMHAQPEEEALVPGFECRVSAKKIVDPRTGASRIEYTVEPNDLARHERLIRTFKSRGLSAA